MNEDIVINWQVDPLNWTGTSFENSQPPEESFNAKVDSFLSELDSIISSSLSKSKEVSSQSQENLILDPLSISPGKPLRPTECSRTLTRDVRSLQAVTEGISALVKLCHCSIPTAAYAFHTCSGNVFTAKQLLDGKGGSPWTPDEDRLVCSRSLSNYALLLRNRSPNELYQRINYYSLN